MSQEITWNSRYQAAGSNYLFGTEPNRFLAERQAQFHSGESAILVADGEGRNSVWLAGQGLTVSAVDISSVAIEKAMRLAAERNVRVTFDVGDMLAPAWMPSSGATEFDWVIGIFIQFAGPEERQIQFQRMKDLTRPGGRILLLGYTPKQLEYGTGGPSLVENLYTDEMLRSWLSDWQMEELVEFEDDVAEGDGHSGRSALIGVVARRPEVKA